MRAAGLLMALGVLAAAPPADAQGRDRRAAAAHFQTASALYADGRWSEALTEFEAGYDAFPLRGFLVNIGQCYRKLERLDEAADAWRRFLATHPPDSKLRSEVEDALGEVEAAQARLQPPPPAAGAPAMSVQPRTIPIEPTAPAETPRLDALPGSLPAVADDAPAPRPAPTTKKSRAWVWAVVGVAVASVAAAAVTVGVVEWQASTPRSGSLGIIDGRR